MAHAEAEVVVVVITVYTRETRRLEAHVWER